MKRMLVLVLALTFGAGLGFAASSQDNRAEKAFGLNITPVGIDIPTLIAPPVGVDYFFNKDWQMGLRIGGASAEQNNGDSKSSATYTNQGVLARWFPDTNSFNWSAGLYQRNWTADATVSYTDSKTKLNASAAAGITANATVLALGLGNQWTYDFGMTLGFDWLVLNAPIATSATSKFNATAAGTTVTDPNADAELKKLSDLLNQLSGLPGLLILQIGWSF